MDLRVAFLPVYRNPYQHLLTAELERLGIRVQHLEDIPSIAWLVRNSRHVEVLHLHWLYGLYMHRYLTPYKWVSFIVRILLARRLGYKIVWTAHNILPHRTPVRPIHVMVRRLVMAQADAVISHCEYGRRELLRRFAREMPTYVVPIGSYQGVYPDGASRAEARDWLGLELEGFTYLFLGNIAAYKGLEDLVTAFRKAAGDGDTLVIAGRNRDAALADYLQIAATDTRLYVHTEYIPDGDMQYFLRSADVMVAPFRRILTSSSVLVGMSFGLPIIAPALGCLPELVTPEAGILYDPTAPDALAEALRQIESMDTVQMGRAAQRIADGLRWEDIAQQTAAIYRECLA